MNKKVKIGLIVGGVLLIGGVVFMYLRKKKKKKDAVILPEDKKIVEQDSGTSTNNNTSTSTSNNTSTSSGSSVITSPFKSKSDGNKFRNWVNDNQSSYATKNSLDRSGSHTNSYITKAWKKFGAEYVADEEVIEELGASAISQLASAYKKVGSTALDAYKNVFTKGISLLSGKVDVEVPTGAFNAEISAKAIKASMKGVLTDDDLFWGTAEKLSASERTLVKNYFNARLSEGTDLCGWIEGDFTGSAETRALKLFGYPTGAGYWGSNC